MISIVEQKFRDWTSGKDALEARRNIYRKIRDIPYAVIPGLISVDRYHDILRLEKGSCTPKHLLLACMYQELGIMILHSVYTFRWADIEIDYPPSLKRRAELLPVSHHLACRAEIEGKLALIDATMDLPLKALGLPVNEHWDGKSDMMLPFEPVGEEQLYHPLEAGSIEVSADEVHLAFYDELNKWLEKVRAEMPER
jgi:hypothetical protein